MLPSSVRIALRNLARHWRRTALALTAIGVAQATMLFYQAVVRGYTQWGVRAVTGPLVGDLQAHHPAWRKERALRRSISGSPGRAAALARDAEVASVRERIYAPALAAAASEGTAALVLGLDLEAEAKPEGLLAGLDPAERPRGRQALLGRGLARALGVSPGAELAVVGQAADGSFAAELLTVKGVVYTPVDLANRLGILVALEQAREIFALPDASHELLLTLRPGAAPGAAARLARAPALEGLEALGWREAAPELASMLDMADAAGWVIMLLVFLAASAGVANTLMMSAFERKVEFGMLLALGARPRRIVAMVLVEAALLGLGGGALGSALALGLLALAAGGGVDMAALGRGGSGEIDYGGLHWVMRVQPQAQASDFVLSLALIVLTALLASALPARRASRLEPVEAMRP